MNELDSDIRTTLEAEVLETLLAHLRKRSDVQNIDLMNLAGFCRNCLSRWYQEAAERHGVDLDKDAARAIVYGMPYGEWKDRYQSDATPEQAAAFEKVMADPGLTS